MKMKRRLFYLHLLIALVTVVIQIPAAIPVAASEPGQTQWALQDVPGANKNAIIKKVAAPVLANGINSFAVASDGLTIYVAYQNGNIYKSTDGGVSFDVQSGWTAAPAKAPLYIAVASDNAAAAAVSSVDARVEVDVGAAVRTVAVGAGGSRASS